MTQWRGKTGFDAIDGIIYRIMKVVSYGSGICLCFIMIVAFVNVVSSKIFNSALKNATDIVAYFNVPICFLSVAYVQLSRGHTNIMLLQSKFHPTVAFIVKEFSNLLGVAISAVLGWRGFIQMQSWLTTASTASANINSIKIWPYAGLLALGCCLLSFCFLWSFIREIVHRNEKGDEPK